MKTYFHSHFLIFLAFFHASVLYHASVIFVQIFMKFSQKCITKNFGMIYTIWGSFFSFFNWEGAVIRRQIRLRKILDFPFKIQQKCSEKKMYFISIQPMAATTNHTMKSYVTMLGVQQVWKDKLSQMLTLSKWTLLYICKGIRIRNSPPPFWSVIHLLAIGMCLFEY